MSMKLRSKILKSFQIRGFTLRSDASKFLVESMEPLEEERQDVWLRRVLGWLESQRLEGPFLTKDQLLSCIREFQQADSDGTDSRLLLADAFSLVPLTYCQERRKFVPRKMAGHPLSPRLFGDAGAKAFFFRERYQLVLQKTARHQCFSSRLPGAAGFDLRPVEHLLGTRGDTVVVLGMICQLEEGKYFLEDPTGSVRIDTSGTKFTSDLFLENSFVLAEGRYDDAVFQVDAMGLPPIEAASESLKYMGGASIFDQFPEKARTQLELSDVPENAMFVLLSDVWLDQPKVLSQLRVLFAGFAEGPPTCFVLAGNFLSRSQGLQKDRQLLREGFKALADLLNEFPLLVKHARFVFVPGPSDPGLSNVLPRPGLPRHITEPLRPPSRNEGEDSSTTSSSSLADRCHWASNPCRLLYCGRELVLWRQDGLAKACRNAVHRPWDRTGLDLAQMYTRSLAANGHLSPLSPAVTPVYWEWDFALWLHPLPDAVACLDPCEAFTIEHAGCVFFNTGSFSKTDYGFRVYYPAFKRVEDSQIGAVSD